MWVHTSHYMEVRTGLSYRPNEEYLHNEREDGGNFKVVTNGVTRLCAQLCSVGITIVLNLWLP